ncbi:MAG TPA: hypothetical protein VK781_09355, partial [Solirubrobacteraceae bacterium]|nr:hypothetical protein [Solirubrobacteraceae bacterium]
MFATADPRARRARRTVLCAVTVAALVSIPTAGAPAASNTGHTATSLGLPIPASERVHGTTSTPATTPATTAPANTTPATTAPPATTPVPTTPATTSTAPAGGAQPGTVAPSTSTPAGTAPPTTTPGTASPPATSSTTVVVTHRSAPKSTRLSAGALALAIL